jgi:chromosome segregation ATPase
MFEEIVDQVEAFEGRTIAKLGDHDKTLQSLTCAAKDAFADSGHVAAIESLTATVESHYAQRAPVEALEALEASIIQLNARQSEGQGRCQKALNEVQKEQKESVNAIKAQLAANTAALNAVTSQLDNTFPTPSLPAPAETLFEQQHPTTIVDYPTGLEELSTKYRPPPAVPHAWSGSCPEIKALVRQFAAKDAEIRSERTKHSECRNDLAKAQAALADKAQLASAFDKESLYFQARLIGTQKNLDYFKDRVLGCESCSKGVNPLRI